MSWGAGVRLGRWALVLAATGFGALVWADVIEHRDTDARVERALQLVRRNKLQAARAIAQDVLRGEPDHAGAIGVMGRVVYDRTDRGPSRAFAQRCAQLAPANADCWWQVSVHAKFDDALELARQSRDCYLALEPNGRYAEHVRWWNTHEGRRATTAGACARAARRLRASRSRD